MDIQIDDHRKKCAFYIDEDGEWVAELTYTLTGEDTMEIDHTEVDEKLEGQGIGKQLVEAAVAYARENGLKVVATCPYARKVIESTPELADALAA